MNGGQSSRIPLLCSRVRFGECTTLGDTLLWNGLSIQSFPFNSEAKIFLQSVIKVEPISSLFCSVTLLTSSIVIRKTSGAVVQVKLIGYDHNQCFGLDCRIGLD